MQQGNNHLLYYVLKYPYILLIVSLILLLRHEMSFIGQYEWHHEEFHRTAQTYGAVIVMILIGCISAAVQIKRGSKSKWLRFYFIAILIGFFTFKDVSRFLLFSERNSPVVLELQTTSEVKHMDNKLYVKFRKNGTCRYTYYYNEEYQIFFEAEYNIKYDRIEVSNLINEATSNYQLYGGDLPSSFVKASQKEYIAYKYFFYPETSETTHFKVIQSNL